MCANIGCSITTYLSESEDGFVSISLFECAKCFSKMFPEVKLWVTTYPYIFEKKTPIFNCSYKILFSVAARLLFLISCLWTFITCYQIIKPWHKSRYVWSWKSTCRQSTYFNKYLLSMMQIGTYTAVDSTADFFWNHMLQRLLRILLWC